MAGRVFTVCRALGLFRFTAGRQCRLSEEVARRRGGPVRRHGLALSGDPLSPGRIGSNSHACRSQRQRQDDRSPLLSGTRPGAQGEVRGGQGALPLGQGTREPESLPIHSCIGRIGQAGRNGIVERPVTPCQVSFPAPAWFKSGIFASDRAGWLGSSWHQLTSPQRRPRMWGRRPSGTTPGTLELRPAFEPCLQERVGRGIATSQLDPSDKAIGRAQPPSPPTLSREGEGARNSFGAVRYC